MLDFSSFSAAAREAITAPDGPLLIVAGPGAGKTTVLAARIAHLVLDRNISPASILALAFTTDAARTLKSRLAGLLGSRVGELDAGTFHAWGLRVVRQWSSALGYPADPPVVYGQNDARALLKAAGESMGWDMPTDTIGPLYEALERARLADPARRGPDVAALEPLVAAYEALLVRRGAVDFAAMLALPLRLFNERPGALRFYQQIYRHVLVDEFQDLCPAQYALIRLLVEHHHNLTVVGDPRQCFPPGTAVRTCHGEVAIERLQRGDYVRAATGRGQTALAMVTNVAVTSFDGQLVRVTLRSGRVVRLTPNHICFAKLGNKKEVLCIYLMYRSDFGFRVGVTGRRSIRRLDARLPGEWPTCPNEW